MGDIVVFALVGCGRVASHHADAINKLKGTKLKYVCDIDKNKANRFAEKYGAIPVTDYRYILDDKDVDVVNIATYSGDHPSIGIDVAKAKKNIVTEKPIGLTLKEIDELILETGKNNVGLCVVHQNRFNPPIIKLKEAIAKGRFGKISHASVAVRWNRNQEYYNDAEWRGTWKQDGGALMNQSIHAIDIFRWLMGEPDEIGAFTATQFHQIEAEDVGVAAVKFQSGALGVIEATTNVYPRNWEETLTIFGENGSVSIGGVALNKIERWEFNDVDDKDILAKEAAQASVPNPKSVYGSGHILLLKEVAKAIREELPMPIDGKDGRNAVEMVLSIYRSQETGSIIKFPLKEESSRILKARGINL